MEEKKSRRSWFGDFINDHPVSTVFLVGIIVDGIVKVVDAICGKNN